jgi:hypothetical protein
MSTSTSLSNLEAHRQSVLEKRHSQEVTLARAYCWLIAVLHPGWAIMMALFFKR